MACRYTLLVSFVWLINPIAIAQFGPAQPIVSIPGGVVDVQAADLDGDGDIDVVYSTNNRDAIQWSENLDGQGTFSAPQMLRDGLGPQGRYLVADLNDDGLPDLAVSSPNLGAVVWMPNLGGASFGTDQSTGLPAIGFCAAMVAHDITGDPRPELLTTDIDLVRYAVNGPGGFGAVETITSVWSGSFSGSPVLLLGDVDMDGDVDIIHVTDNDGFIVLLNDGTGTAWAPTILEPSGFLYGCSNMQLLDVDNDGDLDIVGIDHWVVWWKNMMVESQLPFPAFEMLDVRGPHMSIQFGTAGQLGCGPNLEFIWLSGYQVQWTTFDTPSGGQLPAMELFVIPIVWPGPVNFVIADIDGDQQNELIFGYSDSLSWYTSWMSHTGSGASVTLTTPAPFCDGSGSFLLESLADPPGGVWSGVGVMGNMFSPSGYGPGIYPLGYTIDDGTGCPIGGFITVEVIEEPTIGFTGQLDACPLFDVPFFANPPGGVWGGLADANGVLDADCDLRPVSGSVLYTYTDALGNSCAAEFTGIDLGVCTELTLTAPSLVCESDTLQAIVAVGAPNSNPFINISPIQIIDAQTTVGWFDPSNGPGTYWFYGVAFRPGECIGLDSVQMVVDPAIQGLFLAPFDTLCSASTGYALDQESLPGGTWNGDGVTGNTFTPPGGMGPYSVPLTYTYTQGACTSAITQDVVIYDAPIPSPNIDGFGFCANSPAIQLTAVPSTTVWAPPCTPDGLFVPANSTPYGVFNALGFAFTDVTGATCATDPMLVLVQGVLQPAWAAGQDTTYCIADAPVVLTGFGSLFSTTFTGPGVTPLSVTECEFDPVAAGAGIHELVIIAGQAGSCDGFDTLVVYVSDTIPMVSLPSIDPLCGAGSTTVHTLPAAMPPGGEWSGAFIANGQFDAGAAGAGQVVITYSYQEPDYGCIGSDDLTVLVVDTVVVTHDQPDLVFCKNDPPAQFSAVPGSGVWSAPLDANGLFAPASVNPGIYPVVRVWTGFGGCTIVNSALQVEVLPQPQPYIFLAGDTLGLDTVCVDEFPLLLTSDLDGAWSGDVSGQGSSITVPQALAIPGNTLLITLTASDANGCEEQVTVALLVDVCTGLNTPGEREVWSVHPNPAADRFVLHGAAGTVVHLELFDPLGRQVGGARTVSLPHTVDATALANGTYTLRINGRAMHRVVVAR